MTISHTPIAIAPCPACAKPNPSGPTYTFDTSRKFAEQWTCCASCGTFYLNESFSEQAEMDTNYSITNHLEGGLMMNRLKQKLFEAVVGNAEKFAPSKDGWLDIGCSFGGLLMLAAQRGFTNLQATDIVPEALDYCSKQGIATYRCFSLEEIDRTLPQFNIISAIDSNMFWTDQPHELSLIAKHLNPGGIFIAKIVDRSWLVRLVLLSGFYHSRIGKKIITKCVFNHRFSMPVASFLKVMEAAGLEPVRVSVADALHSREAGAPLKLWYTISDLLYRVTRIYLGPSMHIVGRRK